MKHLTLTKVVNRPDKQFAFATDNDGHEHYVPALIVKRLQMTQADEGAAIKSAVREWSGYADRHPHLMLPCVFVNEDELLHVLETQERQLDDMRATIRRILGKDPS